MAQQHPCRHYLMYLMTGIVDVLADKNKALLAAVRRMDLFESALTEDVIHALAERAVNGRPEGFDPYRLSKPATARFLRDLRVYDMHTKTKHAETALKILGNASYREATQMLLLSRTPYAQTAKTLNQKFGTSFVAQDVATFYHYFFEVEALSTGEWYRLLAERQESLLLRSSLGSDTAMTRWRLGDVDGLSTDIREGLEEIMLQARLRIRDLRNQPTTVQTAKMLLAFAEVFTSSHEQMLKAEMNQSDLLQELESFRQRKETMTFPSVDNIGSIAKPANRGGMIVDHTAKQKTLAEVTEKKKEGLPDV